ncbi:expressed unknown protein [Seminavis robusta]|uniref:YrhK domain-containing protein n=1 Tax=Seminavis robusta TaxID=568900 RepID=A0A9N8DIB7_9STRA|nr:expressed unknown protein [Seminavis robusta]|eukprot:Sro99_g050880.1 n/a (272) ;mRNA; r:58324-59139
MPHLFLPLRPGKYALGMMVQSDNFWADLNAWTYLIGGFSFIIGSVFFLPKYEELANVGSWIFFVASIFYLLVALHDAAELAQHHGGRLELNIDSAAALNYIIGSIVFILGSVFFLPDVGLYTPGAYCFIIGSLCFLVGAVLNGLQIFEAKTKRDAQYLLLIAMSYIIGSVMFLIPSVPYLFEFDTISDEDEIYTFLAAIYIVGSLMFTVGGAINFHRSKAFQELQKRLGVENDAEENEGQDETPEQPLFLLTTEEPKSPPPMESITTQVTA